MFGRTSGSRYLPEESYLYRFLNAEETLRSSSRAIIQLGSRDIPAIRRGQELIERVGLKNDRKRILREYSQGQCGSVSAWLRQLPCNQ
jgi:ABC-2 type transport system ATP-binding protein